MAARYPRPSLLKGRLTSLVTSVACAACLSDSPTEPGPLPGGVASVVVTALRTTLAPGDTLRLTAQVMDANGRVLPGRPVSWSSTTPAVATIGPDGLLTADSVGATTIIATADGRRSTTDILVLTSVLCECTVVLDSARVSLVERNDSTGLYVFEVIRGPPPDFEIGSILVGAEGGGYIRRVEQVTTVGTQLRVETSIAYVEEAVREGGFSSTSFSEEESGTAQPGGTWWGPWKTTYLAPGATLNSHGGCCSLNDLQIQFQIAPDTNVPVQGSLTFTIKDGEVVFAPRVDIGGSFRAFQLQNHHTIFRGDLGLNINTYEVKLQVAVTKGFVPLKKESVTFVIQQRPYATFIGPMPLIALITKKIKLEITPTVSASAVFTGSLHTGFGVQAGVRWQNGPGWRPVAGASFNFDATAPVFTGAEGTVSLKIAVVPEFSVEFYGVVGPFVNLEPYAEAAATTVIGFANGVRNAWDWETRVDLGMNLNLGAKLSLLGRKDLLSFGVAIPIIRPWRFVQLWSDGPLTVRTLATGEDIPAQFGLQLRPAWDPVTGPKEAFLGRNHATSTQDATVAANDSVTLVDIRSGPGAPHQLRLTAVAGNCAVTNPNPVTVAIGSGLFIARGGAPADTLFQVDCIPLGDLGLSVTTTGPNRPARNLAIVTRLDTVGVGRGDRPDSVVITSARPDTVLEDFIPQNRINNASGLTRVSLEPGRRNCAVARPASKQVVIQSGDTVVAGFALVCVPLGGIRIRASTADPDPSPAPAAAALSYQPAIIPAAAMDSILAPPGSVGANDSSVVPDVVPLYNASSAPGRYTVNLGGAPNRCRESAAFGRVVTVFPGDTAVTDFTVQCVERLHVRATTTGPGTDVDGYLVVVENADGTADTLPLGINQTRGIAGILPGSHLIRLADVETSCIAPAAITRLVSGSDSTLVSFVVTCPAPPPPAGVRTTLVETSRIDLAWNPAGPDSVVREYRIYRNNVLHDSTTGTGFSDTGLAPFTTYSYRISTINQVGVEGARSSPLTVRTLDATAPSVPTGLSAVPVSGSRVNLSWLAASDPESGVAQYRVYRDGSLAGTATSLALADLGLTHSTTYSYQVSAVNGSGLESPLSAAVAATTLDGTPPTAPADLAATVLSSSRIDLTWSAAADPESGIQRYQVYRNGVLAGTSPTAGFSDTGLQPGTTYTYTVTAVNGAGLEGPASLPAQASTLPSPLVDLVIEAATGGRVPQSPYSVVVEQGATRLTQPLAPNASVRFPALTAGDYTVTLESVDPRCSVTAPNPRTVTLPAGSGAVTTAFAVSCPR